jgi:very-short-patch-repair endonuclease
MNTLTQRARCFRKNQTPAEEILWQRIRNKSTGVKIVRQKPIPFMYFGKRRVFFADFYCKEARVIIEIDGNVHLLQKDYDAARTHLLNQLGFQVIRFSNSDVFNKTDQVVDTIRTACSIPNT